MNLKERNQRIEELFDVCKKTLQRKGADYSVEDDSFGEFKGEASRIKVDGKPIKVEQAIWLHMDKHLLAILNAVNGAILQGDQLREHIKDAMNYLGIINVWMEMQARAGIAVSVDELVVDNNAKL